MERTIRLAVVGLGCRGVRLARLLADLPGVEVAMLCDVRKQHVRGLQNLFPGAACVTTVGEVVREEAIDGAVVAVPMAENFSVGMAMLAAGKHCLLEPPLAPTGDGCRQLVETAWGNEAVLMVNHNELFYPAVAHMKEILQRGGLGSVQHLSFYRMLPGRGLGGGDGLWRYACHDVAIALHWLNGQMPDRVRAWGFSQFGGGLTDMVHVTLSYRWGCNVQLTTTLLTPEHRQRAVVAGSLGMAVLDGYHTEFPIRLYSQGLQKEWLIEGCSREILEMPNVVIPHIQFKEVLQGGCRHFLQSIRHPQRPLSDGLSGLGVVRVLEVAAASLAAGGMELCLEEV